MEDHGLGYLRRRRSSHKGVTVSLAMEVDVLVGEQECMGDGRPHECVQVETPVELSVDTPMGKWVGQERH